MPGTTMEIDNEQRQEIYKVVKKKRHIYMKILPTVQNNTKEVLKNNGIGNVAGKDLYVLGAVHLKSHVGHWGMSWSL